MAFQQITTRDTQLEKQRLGLDLVSLEDDAGTLKVSVGSIVECSGAVYEVITATETPTGTPAEGEFLFFNPVVPRFEWDATRGAWDAAKAGWYNGSDHRMTKWKFIRNTTTLNSTRPERVFALRNGPPGSTEQEICEIGLWDMQGTAAIDIILDDVTGITGLIARNMMSFTVMIVEDDPGQEIFDLISADGDTDIDGGWHPAVSFDDAITLTRAAAGFFSAAQFNIALNYNRGWMIFQYTIPLP